VGGGVGLPRPAARIGTDRFFFRAGAFEVEARLKLFGIVEELTVS
jgi:hypothetical protein